jgi:type II secretory pathway pseudopilin PulG
VQGFIALRDDCAWQNTGFLVYLTPWQLPHGNYATSYTLICVGTLPISRARQWTAAFSLVEMVVVMGVLLLLMAAGISMLGNTGAQARTTATNTLSDLIEQARTTAITSHTIVVLAIAEPGDLPINDERCFIGLFKIHTWPADGHTLDGILSRRWQSLPTGTIVLPGAINGLRNPRDEPQTTIRYNSGQQPIQGLFHIIAFTPRGGLHWPAGSDPVAMRVAAGTYRNHHPSPNNRNSNAENHLTIGRVIARPHHSDG